MRVTVLGSSASYAAPSQACSGYLVEGADSAVVLDCGNGCLANLACLIDPTRLGAVFISHAHPDHFVDLYALQALLRYAPGGSAPPLPLHLPRGLFERMGGLLSEKGRRELAEAFLVHDLEEDRMVRVGDLAISPRRVDHHDPTFAFRVADGEVTFAYGADAANTPSLLRVLADAHFALVEATLPQRYADAAPHLTAAQAGAAAREAGVHTLALTHIWPTNDRQASAREAVEAFGGPVHLACELDRFTIDREDTRLERA